MNACTVIARNYLAHARVLTESFRAHHPDGRIHVLLLDDVEREISARDEPFELVRPEDVMEPEELERLAFVYDVTELATAVKARFMSRMLDDGASEVLFFDPDIEIFAPLYDVAELARRHAIVLTPHDIAPVPSDRRQPSELQLLQSGAYNLGFIALGQGSRAFLEWWAERLRLHCLSSPGEGLFVDQKWIDFVPGYFEHHILRDPGCNVAYWNLANRHLTRNGAGYLVDDGPLRFFHFSGYDPEKPHLLSRHSMPSPRVLLSERPDVKALCDAYARRLFEHGYEAVSRTPYGLGVLGSGLRIEPRMRRIYRDALLACEEKGTPEPPLPSRDPEGFVRWLNAPLAPSRSGGVSRYLEALHAERPDLRAAFPDVTGRDGPRYLEWVRETGGRECAIPEPFLPPQRDDGLPGERRSLVPGVNVVGYFRAELGIGEAARQLLAAVERARLAHATVTLEDTLSRQAHPFSDRGAGTDYDVNLVCVNADALPRAVAQLGPDFFEGRATVGVWHWELSSFPEKWCESFELVDEIWVASEHAAAGLSVVSPTPIYVVPPPVSVPAVPSLTRAELGLPDRYAFLFVYDFLSVFERKNPLGVLEAFTRAFAPDEGPVLVLKSINGDKNVDALERVKLAAAERPDVRVVDGYVSPETTLGLLASCDCYVSLHRAEGFGLTMAEAMALGKPVIATAYSGNLTYMRNDTAYLVRYRLRPVGEGADPYPASGEWAEPDVEHAASLMRHVFEHPDEALEKGRRAREDIRNEHSLDVRAELIVRRVEEVRSERRAPARTETSDQHEDAVPEPGVPTLHGLAHARAREFPGSAGDATSRLRPALPAARAALYRLLRPYTASLQNVHAALLKDAQELRERVDRDERERLPVVLESIRALDRRIELLSAQMLPAMRRESEAARERFDDRLGRLEDRLALIEHHLDQLTRDATRFQDGARSHLASLTEQNRALGAAVERLEREHHALPYLAQPEGFAAGVPADGMAYEASGGSGDADFYSGFEAVFRGPEASVRDRLRPYVDIVRSHEPVVDLGCGRGEFLDLLKESGTAASGIDVHPQNVERCASKGHRVELRDAVDFLTVQPDASIGCLFSAHFLEHLPLEALLEVLRLSRSKLVSGGLFVAETVNPHSIAAMKFFWLDPTHQKPIFPEAALTLARVHGFDAARILFPRGTGRFEEDLWEQGEYALVARCVS